MLTNLLIYVCIDAVFVDYGVELLIYKFALHYVILGWYIMLIY
jgi:hypothetical protein